MKVIFIFIIGVIIGILIKSFIFRVIKEESTNSKEVYIKERYANYYFIEFLNGILYVLIFLKFNFTLNFIIFTFFISLLITIGFIDFETQYIFDSTINLGIIFSIIFLISKWVITKNIPLDNFIGAVIGYGIIFLIVILTSGMGEGDISLSFLCGLFLGLKGLLLTLFLAFIIGGIFASTTLILKIKTRKDEIAFGPYLAIGAIITTLYGNSLIDFYLTLFL